MSARDTDTFDAHTFEVLRTSVTFLNIKSYYTIDMVKQQLATLAKLHGQFWGSTDQDVLDVVSFRGGFVGLDVSTDTKQACINGFEAAREVIPERLYKRHAEVWPATVVSYERNWQYTQSVTLSPKNSDYVLNVTFLDNDRTLTRSSFDNKSIHLQITKLTAQHLTSRQRLSPGQLVPVPRR